MKVRFCCDSGANIYSCKKSEWFDPVKDLGFDEGNWETMTEDEKYQEADFWARETLEIYYEEKE